MQIIQRPRIANREIETDQLRHSIRHTHTNSPMLYQWRGERERYNMQPRGTRVLGGLPTLSFSRRSSRQPHTHTQSDAADRRAYQCLSHFTQNLSPRNSIKRDCDLDDGSSACGGYWHCRALHTKTHYSSSENFSTRPEHTKMLYNLNTAVSKSIHP